MSLTSPPPSEEDNEMVVSDDTDRSVIYRTEYINRSSQHVSFEGIDEGRGDPEGSAVLEYVQVILTNDDIQGKGGRDQGNRPQAATKAHSYIRILSPAVNEALRCVVDYFPKVDFSEETIKIKEPFEVFVFFERELNEYRERLENHWSSPVAGMDNEVDSCPNRFAAKHLGIAQDFIRKRVQQDVDAERERHARGLVTFDMLWLLYKPGEDVYLDHETVGEHDPYVSMRVDFAMINGSTSEYNMSFWNMDATADWIGPKQIERTVERFAGEKEILLLEAYPCEFLRLSKDVEDEDLEKIKNHFVTRGKKWYNIRRKPQFYSLDGHTTTYPRQHYDGLAMADRIQYAMRRPGSQVDDRVTLLPSVAHPSSPLKICDCKRCKTVVYGHAVKPRFAGYSHINPETSEGLTEHQYFLCDKEVEAFLFKLRTWECVHIDGFSEAKFDKTLFQQLVLQKETKDLIQDLTRMYIRDWVGSRPKEKQGVFTKKVTSIHKPPKPETTRAPKTWSADAIEGKGEGLTFLLHGKPGVGKTYTAECIANYTERPLLSLTCSDIGVNPEGVEATLRRWFILAERWGVIILIDEADVYMEQRQVQDINRNHLVAGFLKALEYYKGILFLTTNRVGTFDEAFMSRIHIQIYYPEFTDAERDRVWNTFFLKLEQDREATMRILQATKDYTQSQELRELKWNGREIRNAFQVAVALAEAEGQQDKQGRVLIKSDHIKATVKMSTDFRDYLNKLHKMDPSKRAAALGNRFDAYGTASGSTAGNAG